MFQGSMVALVTPMLENGDIDYPALDKLVDFHLAEDTDAIVVVGTTGESSMLTEDEHCQVIQTVVKRVSGRIPVIAGTGSNATHEAITLTSHAKDIGVDACLLVTPYYVKPTQEGLYQHYKTVSEAVDVPQILYNVPSRTGCDLLPRTVERLSVVENIVGIKEASGDMSRIREIKSRCVADFDIYSGDDATTMECIFQGGHGVISVTANVVPQLNHDLCQAALSGDRQQAEKLNQKMSALSTELFTEANPIPVKWALAEMGLMDYGIRLPLTVLSEDRHDQVRAALQSAGVELTQ